MKKTIPKHILTSQQLDLDTISKIFKRATQHKHNIESRKIVQKTLSGKYLISLFYEPSTRTRFSFELAAKRLGMEVVETESASHFSSAAKGETLEDSIKVLNQYYPDVIILRHKETGSAEIASSVSEVPIINAGDGSGQHPTQALLDLFTIQNKIGRTDNLSVVAGGDLKNGRTIRSLAYLLSKFENNTFTFVSPVGQKMGKDILKYLSEKNIKYEETDQINGFLNTADVVYWTRTQKERGSEGDNEIVLDKEQVKKMKTGAILMHPLPRIDEITVEVDEFKQAVYFEQAGNGLYVRMALLEYCLGVL